VLNELMVDVMVLNAAADVVVVDVLVLSLSVNFHALCSIVFTE
jgi:hypothetical protein